jgi:RNA polymerase sigma-70 factor (ECF subfamily)
MDRTPVSLLTRLQQPADTEAWPRFARLYTPLLRHWARRCGLSDADAADLVQEVFLILLDKLPMFTFRPGQRFRGWLWTIVANKCRDFHRRQAARPDAVVVGLDGLAADPGLPPDEEEYRRHLIAAALHLVQAEFSPAMWQACWQHVVEGRSAREIADSLGIVPATVYVAKARVLARLRQELAGLLDD